MRRVSQLLLATLVLFACEPSTTIVQLREPVTDPGTPTTAILDGTREGGNPGFFWDRPINPNPSDEIYEDFDPSLLPFLYVEVCLWDGSACVGDPLHRFTSEGDELREGDPRPADIVRIRGTSRHQRYSVRWNARGDGVENGEIYRIAVKAGPVELGYADVNVVQALGTVDPDEFVGINEGWVLPIEFSVSQGPLAGIAVYQPVSRGAAHSCGLDRGGQAFCWGGGGQGRLGTGSSTDESQPAPVAGGHRFIQLASGNSYSCGIDSSGSAHCWGNNQTGTLGDGTTVESSVPVPVAGGLKFIQITGGVAHTCGITPSGAAYCWGLNSLGQLGNGTGASSTTPTPVSGNLDFVQLAAGNLHTCGITTAQETYCWGENSFGHLGDGTTADAPVPVIVQGGHRFTQLTAGRRHTCGIEESGSVRCWGENGNGRLGDGSMTDSLTPVQVEGGHRFTRIAAGRGYTCGLTRASETLCWGADFVLVGQDGIVSDRLVPEPVPGGNTTFAHLAAGGLAGTCGMTGEGWIFCWGANTELGDGSTTRSAVPVRVATPF